MSEQPEHRVFRNPAPPSREEMQELISDGEPDQLSEAVIGLALGEPDLDFVLSIITRLREHRDPGVRGAAVLSLGHLARIHRDKMPLDLTLRILRAARTDADKTVQGKFQDAVDDVKIFAPHIFPRRSFTPPD